MKDEYDQKSELEVIQSVLEFMLVVLIAVSVPRSYL